MKLQVLTKVKWLPKLLLFLSQVVSATAAIQTETHSINNVIDLQNQVKRSLTQSQEIILYKSVDNFQKCLITSSNLSCQTESSINFTNFRMSPKNVIIDYKISDH